MNDDYDYIDDEDDDSDAPAEIDDQILMKKLFNLYHGSRTTKWICKMQKTKMLLHSNSYSQLHYIG